MISNFLDRRVERKDKIRSRQLTVTTPGPKPRQDGLAFSGVLLLIGGSKSQVAGIRGRWLHNLAYSGDHGDNHWENGIGGQNLGKMAA